LSYAREGERGQVLPIVGFALIALLGCVALAVDVGVWRYQQRQAQTAADSAALAGAAEMKYSTTTANITTAATTDATKNGFTANGTALTVTVHSPPTTTTSKYYNDPGSVEVIITKQQPNFFAQFSGINATVSARAVAKYQGGNAGCVYALNASPPNPPGYTFQVTGGGFSTNNCTVVDDGSFNATGGTSTAKAFDVAGTINHTNGVTPAPVAASAQSDPCSALPACAYFSAHPPALTPCQSSSFNQSGTIHPGVYCAGLGVSGGAVTLTSGVYVITGGELKVSGGAITGQGVTFYLAAGSDINLTGGTVLLNAPTSGTATYALQGGGTGNLPSGMLFFQPSSNTTLTQLTGGGYAVTCPPTTPDFEGIYYAPSAELDITGGGGWDPSIIIAGEVNVTGGNAQPCFTAAGQGSQISPQAVLVE